MRKSNQRHLEPTLLKFFKVELVSSTSVNFLSCKTGLFSPTHFV